MASVICGNCNKVTHIENNKKASCTHCGKDFVPLLSFEDPSEVKEFIHNNESSIYGGKNVDGENVTVMLQKGEGMEVHTEQTNGWTRIAYYDEDGYFEGDSYKKTPK